MRLEKEAPQNDSEIEIERILVIHGYKKDDIQFRETYGSNERYLRVGFWRCLTSEAFQEIKNYIKGTDHDFDDDGFWRYKYDLI